MSLNNVNNITSNSSSLINGLKEELLSDIRETENKVVEQINKRWCQMEETNNSLFEKLNQMMEKNKHIFDSLVEQKLKIEKLSDYEQFKNKIEAMVTTHEIRTNGLSSDIINMKTKYDKIFSDNLIVPGFIGPSCQFRNISEYLLSQILENSKTKNERDQFRSDMKEYKSRVDGFLKNMINLNDNSVKRCNEYTDNKEKNFREYLQNISDNLEKKNLEMRATLYKNQEKLFEEIKIYMRDFDDVLDMKNDINAVLNDKFKEYEKEIKKINEKYEEKEKEINHLNSKFNHYNKSLKEMNLIIKEIQFKETVNQMDIIKINSKLKKSNLFNSNKNLNGNDGDKTNIDSINMNNKNNNDNSVNNENYSPIKNNRIQKNGINSFKESLLKGKTVINKKKPEFMRDELFQLKKKESTKNIIFKDTKKEDSEISDEDNKLYKELKYKKHISSKEIIINNKLKNIIYNDNRENKIIKKDINITENNNLNNENRKNSSKRDSNSDYKQIKEKKYHNLFQSNQNKNTKSNLKLNNFKVSKLGIIPFEVNKKFKTLYSDDFISPSTSKGIKFKSLTQKNLLNKIYNKDFNYKVVSLGDKVTLDNDSKDFYSLDFETLQKRSIRINLFSSRINPLKTYQNKKNNHLTSKELNIKVSPGFGSTSYSFTQKNDFPNINKNI